MHKSLNKQIAYLLTIIIIANCILFVTVSFFVVSRSRDLSIKEAQNIANIYANSIESRMKTSHEHVYNIAIDIFDLHGVYETSEAMDSLSIQRICDEMDKKLLVTNDIDILFAYDTILDQRILRAKTSTNTRDVIAIKNFIFDYSVNHSSTYNAAVWNVVTINEKNYLYDTIQIGKYRVGMLSTLSNYANDHHIDLVSDSFTNYIRINQENYFLAGNVEIKEQFENQTLRNDYATIDAISENRMVHIISAIKPNVSFAQIETIVVILVVESMIGILLIINLIFFVKNHIRIPLLRLMEANEQLAAGNLDYRIAVSSSDNEEFYNICNSYNNMVEQISELKIHQYEAKIQEEQNRLRMLRAQVKPHTFLNGITTISNMTYTQSPEKIRDYINSFARFARYMLHTNSEMTTVKNELEHIENYVELQKKKSAVNIELHVKCEEDVKNVEIPFLMLYSLVENSFKHSLTSSRDMMIFINCQRIEKENFKGIMITEEDNGNGFTEEKLEELMSIDENDEYTKEHLGLTNVKYTLKLLYKRNDLLEISNNMEGGARIVFYIPEEEDEI